MVCVKADFVKGTDFLEVFVNYLDMFRVEAFPLEAFLEPNDAPHIQAELERRVSFARENEGVAGPAKKWVAAHVCRGVPWADVAASSTEGPVQQRVVYDSQRARAGWNSCSVWA